MYMYELLTKFQTIELHISEKNPQCIDLQRAKSPDPPPIIQYYKIKNIEKVRDVFIVINMNGNRKN